MRILLAFLSLILLSACHADAQIKVARELKGPVRIVRVERAELKIVDGKLVEGARVVTQITSYDIGGNETEETLYLADGTPGNRTIFTYDADGRPAQTTVFKPDGAVYFTRTFSNSRTPTGKQIEEMIFKDGSTLHAKSVRVYDNRGRSVELAMYDASGSISIKLVNAYDAMGNLVEVAYFEAGGSLTGKSLFSYDQQGALVEKIDYDPTGAQNVKTVFSGDRRAGTNIEIAEYDGGVLKSVESYVRDLDAHGNWIKETRFKRNAANDKPELVQVTYRDITYY